MRQHPSFALALVWHQPLTDAAIVDWSRYRCLIGLTNSTFSEEGCGVEHDRRRMSSCFRVYRKRQSEGPEHVARFRGPIKPEYRSCPGTSAIVAKAANSTLDLCLTVLCYHSQKLQEEADSINLYCLPFTHHDGDAGVGRIAVCCRRRVSVGNSSPF